MYTHIQPCLYVARLRHQRMLKLKIQSNLGFLPLKGKPDDMGLLWHAIPDRSRLQELLKFKIWSNLQIFVPLGVTVYTNGNRLHHGSTLSCQIWSWVTKGDWYGSTLNFISKFDENHGILVAFRPAYTDQGEFWQGRVYHGFTLAHQISPWKANGESGENGSLNFKIGSKLQYYGSFLTHSGNNIEWSSLNLAWYPRFTHSCNIWWLGAKRR